MTHTKKRVLAILLAGLMLLSALPFSALAEDLYTKKGQVALVVYGSEFTDMVAEKKGTAETLKQIGTATLKTVVKVPEVNVTLTSKTTGEVYTLSKVSEDVMNSVTVRSPVLENARSTIDKIPVASHLLTATEDFVANQKDKYLQGFRGLSDLSGSLYNTYKSDRIPVGSYTVNVEETEKDGFLLTDNVRKTWDVDVTEQTGNRPQYLGTTRELGGELEPLDLSKLVDTSSLVDVSALTNTAKTLVKTSEPFRFEVYLQFPGLWAADKDAGFEFHNTDFAGNGIQGSDFVLVNRDEVCKALNFMVEVGEAPYTVLQNAVWGNREQDYLPFDEAKDLRSEFSTREEDTLNFNEDNAYRLVKSYTTLLADGDFLGKAIQENVVAPAILKSTSKSDGLVVFEPNNNVTLTWMLDLIPMILKATGKLVDFGIEAANTAIQTAASTAAAQPAAGVSTGAVTNQASTLAADQITNALVNVVTYANTLVKPAVAELVYPYAQRLGLVGPKLTSGTYILFQSKASDNYFRNPLCYTLHLKWQNAEDVYVTASDLGILTPYFAEGLYDYVRNTTVAGAVDQQLSRLAGKESALVSDVFGGNRDVTAASISYAAALAYRTLGGDKSYISEEQLAKILTFFLYRKGRTAQNVLLYFNRIAEQSKSTFAGYVNSDWHFYNLDRNVSLTATKVTARVSEDIGNIVADGFRA